MTPASTNPGTLAWLLVFVLIGAACYVADRQVGTDVYRWWHDLTSRKPLAKDADIGFIYNRRARARFSVAVFLGVVHSALAVWHFHVNPFTQLITFAAAVPMLMAGFYLGPLCARLWERKNPLLDVVDDLETGKTNIGDVLRKGGERARDAARARFGQDAELPERNVTVSLPQAPPAVPIAAKPAAASPPRGDDPQRMMDQFTRPKKEPGHGGNNAA